MTKLRIGQIRKAIRENKYLIKSHAKQRMGQREVRDADIISVILNGEIIEQTPRAKPFPKCLIMGFVRENEPLYVSCAFDGKYVHIITVHWFDPEKWIDPWTRRR